MKRLLMGIAVGAGAMYLLDPDHGSERRAKLLGFYGENKDTFQEYAQTAATAAVTVGQTAASTAGSVAETVSDKTGIGRSESKPAGGNGKSSGTLDSLLETGNSTRKGGAGAASRASAADPAPGMGGTLSS